MAYRHATQREQYWDFSPGVVLRSAPGFPGFPVRLASELLLRARTHLPSGPLHLWDPCCGSGYLVTVLALLHRRHLASVHASDIDGDAVGLAARNLALLSADGLTERARELRIEARRLNRPAMLERSAAAERLASLRDAHGGAVPHTLARGDAFAPQPPTTPTDVVLTDVPYSELTHWHGSLPCDEPPLLALLRSVAEVVPQHAVLVVTARTRKVALPGELKPLERFRLGSRAAVFLRAAAIPGEHRGENLG